MDELQPGQLLFHIFAWPVKKINKKTSVAQRCGGTLCCGRVVCQTRKRAEIKQKQSTVHVDLLELQTGERVNLRYPRGEHERQTSTSARSCGYFYAVRVQ